MDEIEKELKRRIDFVANGDRTLKTKILWILSEHKKYIYQKILDETSMMSRKNYRREFILDQFKKLSIEHPEMRKMERIEILAERLGISPKSIEYHLYKKP